MYAELEPCARSRVSLPFEDHTFSGAFGNIGPKKFLAKTWRSVFIDLWVVLQISDSTFLAAYRLDFDQLNLRS